MQLIKRLITILLSLSYFLGIIYILLVFRSIGKALFPAITGARWIPLNYHEIIIIITLIAIHLIWLLEKKKTIKHFLKIFLKYIKFVLGAGISIFVATSLFTNSATFITPIKANIGIILLGFILFALLEEAYNLLDE